MQRWQDSGLTAREFASELGLKATTLTFWKWRLKKDQETDASKSAPRSKLARSRVAKAIQFVELKTLTTPVGPLDTRLELVIGSCIIRIPNGFDDVTLRRLLVAVRECP